MLCIVHAEQGPAILQGHAARAMCVAGKCGHIPCSRKAFRICYVSCLLLSCLHQALSALVERSGCDIRTAINTMQLLARQASDSKVRFSRPSQPSSQRSRRVTVTASSVWSSAALGLKDVSRTPLGVMQDLLTAGTNKAMTLRLHQLSVATTAARRDGNNIRAAAIAGATAAARLQLQEHYNMLLDLGEHELVSEYCAAAAVAA